MPLSPYILGGSILAGILAFYCFVLFAFVVARSFDNAVEDGGDDRPDGDRPHLPDDFPSGAAPTSAALTTFHAERTKL